MLYSNLCSTYLPLPRTWTSPGHPGTPRSPQARPLDSPTSLNLQTPLLLLPHYQGMQKQPQNFYIYIVYIFAREMLRILQFSHHLMPMSRILKTAPVSHSKTSRRKGRASDSSAWQNIIGEGGKTSKTRRQAKGTAHVNGAASKQQVQTKVIDNKLKIIDDVPSSAVEMAVKEKFLKKVQRQERIVEEVKLVLKPAYNQRRITKEAYKEILKKTVPKVMSHAPASFPAPANCSFLSDMPQPIWRNKRLQN